MSNTINTIRTPLVKARPSWQLDAASSALTGILRLVQGLLMAAALAPVIPAILVMLAAKRLDDWSRPYPKTPDRSASEEV